MKEKKFSELGKLPEIKLSDYTKKALINSAILLNEHLLNELTLLENKKNSRITNRVLRLAESTAQITDLAFLQISDIDTIIENTMSK